MELKQIGYKDSKEMIFDYVKVIHDNGEESVVLRIKIPQEVREAKIALVRALSEMAFGKSSSRVLNIKLFSFAEDKEQGYNVTMDVIERIGGFETEGKIKKIHLQEIDEHIVEEAYENALIKAKSSSEQKDYEKQADLLYCKRTAYTAMIRLFDIVDQYWLDIVSTKDNQLNLEFSIELPEGVTSFKNQKSA